MKNLVKSMLFAALIVVGVSCEKQFEETVAVQSENHAAKENSTYPDKGYFLNDAFIVTVGGEERAYVKNREIIYNIYPKQ